jgi:hypothetical protein
MNILISNKMRNSEFMNNDIEINKALEKAEQAFEENKLIKAD